MNKLFLSFFISFAYSQIVLDNNLLKFSLYGQNSFTMNSNGVTDDNGIGYNGTLGKFKIVAPSKVYGEIYIGKEIDVGWGNNQAYDKVYHPGGKDGDLTYNDGFQSINPFTSVIDTPVFPSTSVIDPGSGVLHEGNTAATAYTPGKYNRIQMDSWNKKLYLKAGIYHFNAIDITQAKSSIIIVPDDNGDFSTQIYLKNTFNVNKNRVFVGFSDNTVSGELLIFYGGSAKVLFGDNTTIVASLIAPNATVELKNKNAVLGQIMAKNLFLHSDYKGNFGIGKFTPLKPKLGHRIAAGDSLIITEDDSQTKIPISLDMAFLNDSVQVQFEVVALSSNHNDTANISNDFTLYHGTDSMSLGSVRTMTFPAADTLPRDSISIVAHGDFFSESTEKLFVRFFDIDTTAELQGGVDTLEIPIYIKNNPSFIVIPDVSIAANSANKVEGSNTGATSAFTFDVSLSTVSADTVKVDVSTQNGTASVSDSDFQSYSQTITFIPGATSQSISVLVNEDFKYEPNESFTVHLSNPSNGILAAANVASATIINDDTEPTVSLSGLDLIISEDGGSSAVVATLSNPSFEDVVVSLDTGGSAILSLDYTLGNSITIPAGQLADTIPLLAVNDTIYEGDENALISIIGVTNGTEDGSQSVDVEITEDESIPSVTLTTSLDSVLEDGGVSQIIATLSHASTQDITVTLSTTGSASQVADYILSDTIVISAGSEQNSITLTSVNDTIYEGDETATISISAVNNGTEDGSQSVDVEITEDESIPSVTLTTSLDSVLEDGGVSQIIATLSHASTQDITVTLSTTGSASQVADYILSDTIVISAGSEQNSITLTSVNDTIYEGDEMATISIIAVNNGTEAGVQSVNVNITEDETIPSVILTASLDSISEDGGASQIIATLSHASTQDVTVTLDTSGAAILGLDYILSDTIVISAGSEQNSITLTSVNDTIYEGDETATISISGVNNAAEAGVQSVNVIITEDESIPSVTLSVSAASALEDGGTSQIIATLSHASAQDITVTLSTSGSASQVADYILSNTILMSAGSEQNSITLTSVNDTIYEGDETAIISISGVTNGTEEGSQIVEVEITEDETIPSVTLTTSLDSVLEDGGASQIIATLSHASSQDITVTLSTSGSASQVADYSLSNTIVISAGDEQSSIVLTSVNDTIYEGDETATLSISGVTNGTADGSQIVDVTIIEDETIPSVTLTTSLDSISEDGGASQIIATLSHASSQDITVTLSTSGSASQVGDYILSNTILISAGDEQHSIILTSVNDTIYEGDEEAIISISGVSNGIKDGLQSVDVEITEDESIPSVTLTTSLDSVLEDGGASQIIATLSHASTQDITVTLSTSGPASQVADYILSNTIEISAGDEQNSITLTSVNDTIYEGDETAIISISAVNNGTQDVSQSLDVTIIEDESEPIVTLTLSHSTLNENGGSLHLIATLSHASTQNVVVNLGASGPATHNVDYSLSNSLSILAGTLQDSIVLTAINDTIYEGDEAATISIVSLSHGSENGVQAEIFTLNEDEGIPTLTLSTTSAAISETGGNTYVIATLSHATSVIVDVTLTFSGIATANSDYTLLNSIQIAALVESDSILLTALDDALNEGNETIIIDVASVSGAIESLSQQATVTIFDDDTAPNIRIDDVNINEANTDMTFTVTLDAVSGLDVNFNYNTADATALAGFDYTAKSSSGIIPAGTTQTQITIGILDDSIFEGTETYSVNLSAATNATISDAQGIGEIVDDEDTLSVSIDSVSLSESDLQATLTITLSGATGSDVSVNYATTDQSALAGQDYTAKSSIVTFIAGGSLTQTVIIDLLSDAIYEGTEDFRVDLLSPIGAVLVSSIGIVSISDDEAIPEISIADLVVDEDVGVAQLTLSLNTVSANDIIIDVKTQDSTTTSADYSALSSKVTFTAGSSTANLDVTIIDDLLAEEDEYLLLKFSNALGAVVLDKEGVVTIRDNDNAPVVSNSINDTLLLEDFSGSNVFDLNTVFTDVDGQNLQFNLIHGLNNANLLLSGNSLILSASPDANGKDTVIVSAFDGANTALDTFVVEVTAINDAPSFQFYSPKVAVKEDAAAYSATNFVKSISFGPSNESSQAIAALGVKSVSNNALFKVQPTINARGDLQFSVKPDVTGTSVVEVRLQDDGGFVHSGIDTLIQSFVIEILSVNDQPSFTMGSAIVVAEDVGNVVDTSWASSVSAGPINEASQSLNFKVSSSNAGLFEISPKINASNGDLEFKTKLNQNGTAQVYVTLVDDGGVANGGIDTTIVDSFTITITPVDDAPVISFTPVISVAEDEVLQTLLTNISVTDVDGDAITLQLDSIQGNLLTNTLLSLDPSGNLVLEESLDYERDSLYTVFFTIASGSVVVDTSLTLNVTDIKETTLVNILEGIHKDSIYPEPDTLWVNDDKIKFTIEVEEVKFDTLYTTQEGRGVFEIIGLDPKKDTEGKDTVIVLKNTQKPKIEPDITSFPKDEKGTIYVQSNIVAIDALVTYIDDKLNEQKVNVAHEKRLEYGKNTVVLTYTDIFGNISENRIEFVVDTMAPIVKILSPTKDESFSKNFTNVTWTVDGEVMNIQNTEVLEKEGKNLIIRSFTDFAGNKGSDSVYVKVNYGVSDIKVDVVDKVVRIEDKNPDEYYEKKGRNKPQKEVYSVFVVVKSDQNGDPIYNKSWQEMTSQEKQNAMVLHELNWEDEFGKHGVEESFDGRNELNEFKHLGITMEMELSFPNNQIPDGKTVGSCEQGDLLWDMTVRPIRMNVFDQIGQYVTGFEIPEVLIDDPRYLDKNGNVTLRVELPIPTGAMESESGASAATGVYLLSTAIATQATPSSCNTVGRVRKTSRSILTPVGYAR